MTQHYLLPCVFPANPFPSLTVDGTPYLTAADLARALGYADERAVSRIYNRHSEEFTVEMSLVVNLTTKGFGSGNSENLSVSSAPAAATWWRCSPVLQSPPRFVAGCWMCWKSFPRSARRELYRYRSARE